MRRRNVLGALAGFAASAGLAGPLSAAPLRPLSAER